MVEMKLGVVKPVCSRVLKVICVNSFLGKYLAFRRLHKGEDKIRLDKTISREPLQ